MRNLVCIALFLSVLAVAVSCSSSEGHDSPVDTRTNLSFDLGDILTASTPRMCVTAVTTCNYGSGAADQLCVCYTPYGPFQGMTAKY